MTDARPPHGKTRSRFSIARIPQSRSREALRRGGFSLVELLAVLAILALLAGLVLPVADGVRTSALRTATRARFAQWIVACEAFRHEYGHYPVLVGGKLNGAAAPGAMLGGEDFRFREALTGFGTGAGSPAAFQSTEANLTSGTPRAQNFRRIGFLAFATDEIDARGAVVDAFGNGDITVLFDDDGDGVIPAAEILATAARVRPASGGDAASPDSATVPIEGVRASVLLFSAGEGWTGSAVDRSRVVVSWRRAE